VLWLEKFLVQQKLPVVVVSHDREFLDRVCTKIVEVEEGSTVPYAGNYSHFLEQKRARLSQWLARYDKQSRYVKEQEMLIKEARGDPAQAHVARSKEAALSKLRSSADFVLPPPRDRKFRFRFPSPPRCGDSIVEVEALSHGYGDGKYRTLFSDVAFQVTRGDRIGLIGPNGSGAPAHPCSVPIFLCLFSCFKNLV
jgi:ATP-binding cassette, subfamily F, member 3